MSTVVISLTIQIDAQAFTSTFTDFGTAECSGLT